MKVANDNAASALGHHWFAGEAIDLSDEEAAELVSIRDSGFYTVADDTDASAAKKTAPKRGAKKITEIDPASTDAEVADDTDASA